MLDWMQEHGGTVIAFGVSLGVCLAGAVGAVILVVFLPPTFLKKLQANGEARAAWGWKRVARNVAGWGLMAAGAAMMVLPGPGVVALMIGVAMADFPGKKGLLKWLLTRPRITRSMNRLRARFGKPPFEAVQPGAAAPVTHRAGPGNCAVRPVAGGDDHRKRRLKPS